jgi:hypothetical protein
MLVDLRSSTAEKGDSAECRFTPVRILERHSEPGPVPFPGVHWNLGWGSEVSFLE